MNMHNLKEEISSLLLRSVSRNLDAYRADGYATTSILFDGV